MGRDVGCVALAVDAGHDVTATATIFNGQADPTDAGNAFAVGRGHDVNDGRLRPAVRERLERGETGVHRGRRLTGVA